MPLPFAAIAPALVTGGTGVVNSLINAFSTSSANKRNVDLAREQMAWQSAESEKARQASRDFALEMFDLENAYNTPLAQIERLRAAGINPYAALSQGSSQISGQASGNASLPGLMPGGVAMPHVSPIPSPVAGFLPALQAFAEIRLKDAQAKRQALRLTRLVRNFRMRLITCWLILRIKRRRPLIRSCCVTLRPCMVVLSVV